MCDETSRTILCIDDDRGTLDYHRALLERSGYQVLTASSARCGVQIARTSAVALVLVDYYMPEMTGDEVADAIKRVKPGVPIVMVPAMTKFQKRCWAQWTASFPRMKSAIFYCRQSSFCGNSSSTLHGSAVPTDLV